MASKFEEKIKEATKVVKEKKTRAYSKAVCSDLAQALINSPDYTEKAYVENNGKLECIETNPGRALRDAIKNNVGRKLNIDKSEMGAFDNIEYGKDMGKALVDVSSAIVHNMMKTGRRFTLLPSRPDEAKMNFSIVKAPQKEVEKRKLEKQEVGGKVTYVSTPTQEISVTKEHYKGKVENKAPSACKSTKPKK